MTISSEIRKAGPFTGNGATSVYPFAFKVFAEGDIRVVAADLDAVESALVLDADYSVTLNGDQDASPGGTITLLAGALTTGFKLAIVGDVANLQGTDLTNQGGFYPQTIEDMVDRATIQIQQLQEEVDRSAKLPTTSELLVEDLVEDLLRLADSADEIDTVAGNIDNVNTVSDNISNINAAVAAAAAAAASESSAAASVAAATIQANRAESEADDAENSANIASAAVSGSVNTFFAATKSAADTLAASLPDGATVIVDRDETLGGISTRNSVASGSLTFVADADSAVKDQLYGSQLGMTASSLGLTSGSDMTSLLNGSVKDTIVASGARSLILDNGDIQCDGLLDYAYNNITFTGDGRLLTTNSANMLERLPAFRTKAKYHVGSLLGSTIFSDRFYTAVHTRKDVRIVLFGDSISAGPDFDSLTPAAGTNTASGGVDAQEFNNSLVKMLYNELLAILPRGTRIRLYSRSIPGYSYNEIANAWDDYSVDWTGREGVSAAKPWRDCVLDINPDLVIHSMGMNHYATNYVNDFTTKWHDYIVSKKLVGTFDQALITTPNPNFEDAGIYGDFRDFIHSAGKFHVAHQQRWVAKKYGYSLIDVAALSTIKRYGIDSRSVTMDALPHEFANATLTNSSIDVTHPSLPIYNVTQFDMKPSRTLDGGADDVRVTSGGVIVQFNSGMINIYSAIGPNTGPYPAVAFPFAADQTYNIRVEVIPSLVSVYVDNALVLSQRETFYQSTIPTVISNANADLSLTLTNIKCFAQHFPRYAVDTVPPELFGKINNALNKYAGGINHPSVAGLAEIYLPPIREVISFMASFEAVPVPPTSGLAIGDLVYIGTVDKSLDSAAQFIYSDSSIVVHTDGLGVVTVENHSSQTVYITANGDVFITIVAGFGISSPLWVGKWKSHGFYNYAGAAADAPALGTAYIKSGDTITVSNGVTTVRKHQDELTGVTSVTIPVTNVGGTRVVACNIVSLKAVDTLGAGSESETDLTETILTTTGISFKVVFRGDLPSVTARRIMYEYSYRYA